jgi:hypothetical protein
MFDISKQRRRIKRRIKNRVLRTCLYLPVLAVCTASSVFFHSWFSGKIEYGFKESVTGPIQPSPSYDIDKKQSLKAVKEVQIEDAHLIRPFEPVDLITVSYKTIKEETKKIRRLPANKQAPGLEEFKDNKNKGVNNEYYVQVSSSKNYKFAERILIKLKEQYPNVSLVEHNSFYKVRITGIMTKKQGNAISEKIEEQFSMKPILVQKKRIISLADAVRPYIGTSYTRIDCYGLIVRGLMNQGVKYHGNGGLRKKLENLAANDGLPHNAYLNGEGLIEKKGTKIFSKSLLSIIKTDETVGEIYSEMEPYLQDGLVLSFSTPTRGHTGIISKQKDVWTYINSGVIDNQIYPGIVSERVGEEYLRPEIKKWMAFAEKRNESLSVTLGRLDADQL